VGRRRGSATWVGDVGRGRWAVGGLLEQLAITR